MPNYIVIYVIHYDWHFTSPEDRPGSMMFDNVDTANDYYNDMISQYPGLSEIQLYEYADGKYWLKRKWMNK